jgi:hypothetical protein
MVDLFYNFKGKLQEIFAHVSFKNKKIWAFKKVIVG